MKKTTIKTTQPLCLRTWEVRAWNNQTNEEELVTVTFSKAQLQAAQIIGESSKELITRTLTRQGYRVLDVSKAVKTEVTLQLDGLYEGAVEG